MSRSNSQPGTDKKKTLSLPSDKVMQSAAKLSIKHGKPIDFYFYIDSVKGLVSIRRDDEHKVIFKSEDEHSSPIENSFKCEQCYIFVTSNTIYVTSSDIKL